MSRALFFVAILIIVAYAVFYKNMKSHVPQTGNVEQTRMHQAGGDDNGGPDTPSTSGDNGQGQ